ncbi:hypothetical protein RN001_012271 [Aquatica leii]|uniref:Hemocytin n=1 Tax=Aquatica leii TaxID=1421715 RepID=A0AAN7SF30_9COLE|nr:hypothetical protein RN001_012271 [Aquatica leii]
MLPIPSRLPGIQTQISAHYIVINVDVIGLKIKWDAEHFVEVSVTEDMWNKTAGLCGLFDSDETNDLTSKKGGSFKNVATLVKSWEIDNIGETCTEIPTEKNTCKKSAFNTDPLSLEQLANKFCKNLLTNAQFASCQHALDLQLLQNTCVWDYCECQETNPQHCACQTLDILSRVCVQKGLTSLIKWRDDKTCPYKCSGGKVYMPCGPPGGQPVCGGLSENLVPNPECEEGCYCPEGTAFHKNTCIPIESCPCMNNFKEYTNGESIQKDCNTCTCRKGKWTCTDKTCGARCSIIGDPHYVTFDGARYDFVGTCSYYLLKHNNFTIEAKNSPCLSSLVQNSLSTSSCVRSIVIKIREHVINLKQNHEVTVNGEEIFKLPFNLEGVIIREASSVFIIVELPNDVFVWWNSKSNTAYIDVSPNMVGETKGLCGVFNQNQRDDFLTPDGDIEHDPIPFANKWKTEETCQDVAHTIQKNPCSVNIHKLPIATENCQIIKGSIFRECQLVVDPDPFFADCMHDMCNCEEDLKDCLCPMVSAYAIQCAAKGVIINWREAIPQCSMNCTKGQQYQICGNSCTRSCSNFEFTSNCIQSCVEGCNCPPGQSLDVDGDCVEIKKCGCYYKTEHYNNDYKQIRDIKGLLSLCTCSDAEWTCRPATPNEIDIYPNDLKDTCNKNEHKEYTPCEPVEYKTCKNMHTFTATSSSPIVCHTGCQCEKDYVLDTETNKCVKPEECPCHHGGQSYKEDSIVHNDCNLCKCVQGKWKCTDKECLGECSAWGDSHYKTFDGRSFDFQGQCDYILARGTLSNKYSFDVSIQNVPCSTLGVSCSKSITIRAGIKPNQETITLTKEEEMPSYALLKHMILKQMGHFVIIDIPEIKLILHWDKGTRVYIKLGAAWKNKVEGLCGNFNDDQLDDFQTPSGGIPEVSPMAFGDSWRLQHLCPKSFEITDTCTLRPDRKLWAMKQCGILKTSVFASCHSEEPVEPYLERCIFDTCACDQGGDCNCLCTALAAYAHECDVKGISVKWRTPDLCPMQCDERCSNYEACLSPCPHETCDNMMVFGKLMSMCKQDVCIEGCQVKPCPEGEVFTNSSLLECVPKSNCNPVCLQIGNIAYLEGDLIEQDECHTCYCSRGNKVCQGQPCTTLPPTTKQILTTSMPQIQEMKCTPGWTAWINENRENGPKESDFEPLPNTIIMSQLGETRCHKDMMVDIECRTSDSHLSAKETNLNVECSLEKGLICTSSGDTDECPDFEIRVKCQCQEKVIEVCEVNQPYQPHAYDCYLYYRCEKTEFGNELVVRTCGPSLMFNPKKRKCDFPKKVYTVRPECQVTTTAPITEACSLESPNQGDSTDCYIYYRCEKTDRGNEIVAKTCYPDFMFNIKTLQCDFASNVNEVRSECREQPTVTEACNIIEPNKPHSSDCYLYYSCESKETGAELVGKTCGPNLMFNPVKAKCDFPMNVGLVRPECQPTLTTTETVITAICDLEEPNRPHPYDCHLYYKCEKTDIGNNLVEKSCGSMLMFNPLILKCDFPKKVTEVRPDCKFATTIQPITITPIPTPVCSVEEPSKPSQSDCYKYYRCEKTSLGIDWVTKTCYPELMFNPETKQCDLVKNVQAIQPQCEEQPPVTEPCDITEANKPHTSDCYLYYRCEQKENRYELVGRTCGPMLMFNPVKLKCDFPANVAQVRPECEALTLTCDIAGPNIADPNDCYLYYKCEENQNGVELIKKTCYPEFMFNPVTSQCEFPEQVEVIRPQCKTKDECKISEPNHPNPNDCYTYYKCEEKDYVALLVKKSCKPDFMFNPILSKCDFPQKVIEIKPECKEEVSTTQPSVSECDITDSKKPHPSDCYLYYQCEETEKGNDLVGRTCGPMLMFNSVKLKCDFPVNVAEVRPECAIPTQVAVTEVCDVTESNRPHPSDCHLYYRCEKTVSGNKLEGKTCGSMLMFNPVKLVCDFPANVAEDRPECKVTTSSKSPTTTAMPICDIVGPSISDPKDCYLYYKCEKRDNTVELVKKTCYPEFMFNSITSQCDFPEQVGVLRPECANKPLPTEACDVAEPNKPHPSDCHLYYRCEDTITGNKLVGKTCGSMLMFNPVQLTCDFPVNVAKVRPECQATTLKPVTEVCEVDEPNRPKLNDCYSYYQCQKTESGNDLVEKTCGPRNMFNPVTLQCDESENVVNVKPECEVITSQLPPSEECAISEPNRPMPNDCYTYYRCEEKENIPQLVEKSCKPDFMFNPVTLKCDFPETVELLMPECKKEVPTTQPSIEKVCSTTDEKKPHVSDCYLYYQCEETEHQNEVIGKTCGPMLMFNPVKLKCDFPENVAKVRSECAMQTSILTTAPTEICDVTEPKRSHPSDCFLYYNCEESDGKPGLVESTCGPMLMFNPVSLKCDFPKNVVKVKPECSSSTPAPLETKSPSTTPAATLKTTPTPKCDVAGMSVADPDDCYLYYKCEEKENEVQLVKKTCYPEFMFNTVTLQCDFPESVSVIRPECKKTTLKPQVCETFEAKHPHPSDCYLYYECEETPNGNEVVGRTCGPMLMFNPIKLVCDFPVNVAQIRAECKAVTTPCKSFLCNNYALSLLILATPTTVSTTLPVPVCDINEPKRPHPSDCFLYTNCEETDTGNALVEQTCGPTLMFNPITLKCDFPAKVVQFKPECEIKVSTTALVITTEICAVNEPTKPHPSDCYLYYRCEDKENGAELVGKTCGPMLMFNPVKLKCDFPDNVIKIKPECQIQACSITEPTKAHESDCYLYYKCEETSHGNDLVEQTCGPMLMFNPLTLKCDFPTNVIKVQPDCTLQTPSPEGTPAPITSKPTTKVCDVSEPNLLEPSDCYLYYKCEEKENDIKLSTKTCYPEFMFNPVTLQCDFPDKVSLLRPECAEVSIATEACDINEPSKSHLSDCYLYYKCVEMKNGAELVGNTCGPDLMFNPIKLKCDFPANVVLVRPECHVATVITKVCDVTEPKRSSLVDCYKYYQCEMTETGEDIIEKTCGPLLMFNPLILKCDFPKNVEKVKPECSATTEKKICDDDEHYDECAIDCTRLCQSYQQTLLDKQMCIDNKCEPGCVPNLFNCGPDMFWKDERTCVPKKDCMCTTNDGYPVKPGVVTSETECRRCQCVDNFYTCDESACTTTTIKPITRPVVELTTTISYEKTTISIVTPPPEFIQAGVWAPEENDKEPFLQIHFERQELIYGIKIKGNPILNQFVRSYAVSYSPDNGKTYHYIRDINKQLYYFKGCIDSRTVSTQYLPAPIEATDIKIHPITNNNGVAMKVELIGCKKITTPTATTTTTILPQPLCKDPMGVENGLLSLDQISVSSELNTEHNKEYLKINGKSAWQTITNNPTEWVQFDFLEPRKLTGITTQGGNVGWVTAYIVKYSPDGKNWNPIIDKNGNEKTFYGNVDQNTIETNYFDETIQATYIRVYPVSWHENIQMRIEPKGCFVPYLQPTTVIPTTQTPSAQTSKICNVCPDITLPNDECLCNDKAWWDGDKCVERSYCPCIDQHITYPVGGAFENAECEECVCKLGGVVHCTKKTCNPCAHGLKSVLTSTCNCVCEPCKVGTVLCPTSNICIDEDSWCNGVKDCPDDETGCVTTPELIETTSVVPKKECIIPKCIETYEPVKVSDSDSTPWNRKTAFTTKSANSGVKTGAKITKNPVSSKTPGVGILVTQERKQVIKNQISLTECPLYECKPKYPNEEVCPKIECPLGEHYVLIESNNNCQEYICELDQPEDAVCELSGSTFETFDGVVYEYDIFDHILARDMIYGAWIITLQEECIEICTSRIIIEHDEDVFVLYSDLSIKFNTRRYSIFEIKKLMYKANTIDFDITHLGHQVLFISNKYGFWVIWDEQENGKIGMTQKLSGQVDGLCGYFDKNPGDDKMKPDGEVGKTTEEFVNSWKTPNSNLTQVVTTCNANVRNEAVDLCNSIDEEAFESCKSSVNVDKFKSQCVHSTCNCLKAANGDPMEKEQCRCLLMQNFVVECLSEDSTVELFDWRTLYNCPTTCEEPLVHYDCYQRRCEPTCGNLADYSACPKIDNICFPGCYCPKGYVRRGKECVLPIDCEDCVCHLLPHLKYVTYDKETYTIDGDCEYVITQDQTNENGEQAFNILAKTIPCTNDKNLTCVDSIRILYNNHELKITRDTNENKIALLLDSTQLKNYDDIEKWVNIEMNPDENLEISLSEIQVKIQIYYPKLAATFSLPSIKYGGKLEGLCGNCNENPKDDYITSNKTIPKTIDEFGESWVYNKAKECKNKPLKECTLSEEESSICNHLLSEPFHECNEDLDPSIFIEWCKEDICNNEQPIACEAFEAYAKECNYLGYCVEWRSSICPAKCAPGLEFKSCPSVCSLTCETYNSNDCSETALEGCVCPEGQVLFNSTTCVPNNKCIPCDEEEHYSGDTWIVDKCTKCSCNGQSKTCETKTCPSVDSLCQDGYKVEMIPLKDECCDKYVCVPITGTEVPCEAPQPITCSENQIMTIVKKSDGCMQYACECIPVDECEKIDLDNIPSSETGVTHEIDNNGCCPIAVEKCQKELCPTKPTCPEFHTISVKNGTCCEFYTCDPLKDKCIVALKYEDDENGGEKEVKQRIVVKEVNETWKDGPCRTCQCQSLVTDTLVDTCTLETCPNKPEETDYVYKPIFIKGTCCPMFEKVSCVMDDIIHKVGETWTKEEDYCTRYKCDQVLGGVEKIISVNHCEETCELGWSYTQPAIDSKQCCGECKPTGCVVNNTIYVIGEKWKSSDNCINYHCSNDNGQVHVETDKITCPEIDKEILENYVIEQEFKEGNCCMDLELTACKANGKTYQVGESWPAPDGDKCKSIVCTKNSLDEITKQEAIETCNSECAKGWEYKKSDYECCGECVQVACVINGNLKFLGEQWKSEDGCTTFSCEMNEGQLRLVSQQQSCPDVSKCPSQYLVESECCSHCNLPISTCAVVPLNATNTIGKISIEELGHGICINKNPIVDLAECNGVCESLASFDFSHMNYNSKCTCCQVEEVKDITVELECEDGNVIKRQIPVAVNCKCKECVGL